jgi:hypothetical protein
VQNNVTPFPIRSGDDPREIMFFADGYMENLFFGNGWRRLAKILAANPGSITPLKMMDFVTEIAAREERPAPYYIAQMVGIMVTSAAHNVFRDYIKEEKKKKNANVVSLGKRK